MKLSLNMMLIVPPLAVVAAMAATPAKADLMIKYQIGSGPLVTAVDAPSGTVALAGLPPLVDSGLTLTVLSVMSNSPGQVTKGDLTGSALALSYSGTAATDVKIYLEDTGFEAPITPPSITLYSDIGGTVTNGPSGDTLAFRSCISAANAQDACPGTVATNFVTPSIVTPGGSLAYDGNDTTLISSLSDTYSVTEEIDLHLLSNTNLNFSSHTDLNPVPEPGTLFLLGASLVGFGLIRRRRKSV